MLALIGGIRTRPFALKTIDILGNRTMTHEHSGNDAAQVGIYRAVPQIIISLRVKQVRKCYFVLPLSINVEYLGHPRNGRHTFGIIQQLLSKIEITNAPIL